MNPSRLLRAVRQDDARILLQIVSERGLVAPDLLRACEAIDSLDEILRRLPPRARAEIENLRACDAWFCPACQMSARSAGSAGPARCAECGSPLREQVAADALLPHRYQLLREVGQGGMSIVYEALDRRLRRRVAVKTLRQSNAVVLRREAQAVARLCHPNIVTVHEAVFEAANPFIVMDFVEGPSLAKALHTGAVSLPEALGLLETVARAVHYAHANQVIHRDLKPSNILLRSTGEPVITDFGLARVVDASRVTRKGEIAGTAPYMAPEQVNGDLRRIDGRTDVYALGVILYEMLAGRLPFDGDVGVVYGQILTKEPAPPRPGDADLSCICLKALSKDPADRYATAADFADDLRRAREGDPVRARPAPLALRLWKTARKHRRLSALSAAVGVLLATLVTGLVTAEIRASRERAQRIRELQDAARWRDAEALLEPVSRTLDEAEYAETPLNEDVVSRLRAELGRVYSRWPEFPPALLQEGRLYFLSGAWDAAQVPLDRAAQDARTAPAAHYTSGCLNIERYRSARAIPAFTCDSRGAWLQAQPFERESPQEEAWRQRALRDLETYNRLLLARVQQSPVTLSDTDRGRFGRALAVIYRESSPEACAAAAEDILRCTTGVSRFSVESAAGTAYYVAGDWGRARELLDNALRRRPHHVATRYTLAFACVAAAADRMRKDDPRPSLEEALRHLEMLAAEEPARAVFSVFCAQVRCGLATLARPPSAELLAEALRDVEKALQMDASLSLAWMVRGNIWVARADRPDADAPEALGRARESYERALELDPNDLSTRVNLASILLDMAESHAADALRHFDQVIQRNDTIPAAWLGRASARRLMARPIVDQDGDPRSLYDEVERDCGRAIELLPKDPAAYCLRAQMWADRARFEMTLGDQTDRWWNLAVQDLQRAIELDPEYVLAVNNLGSVYQSKATTQDLDAPRSIALLDMSIATYTRALDALKSGARRVTRADVLEGRASAYRNRARAMEDPEPDLQRSLSDYDEAIERAPKSAGLLHGRGVTWCDRGVARQRLGQDPREDYRRAAEDLRQAIALGGEGARVRLDLACALGNLAYFTRSRSEPAQELYESAMREYDRAVEQNPKNPEIRFLRGKMRLLWGELRSALDGFRESAALDPRWAAACEPYIQRCEAALRTN